MDTESSAPTPSPTADNWWQSIEADPGQIDSFKFGGRNVHLRVDGIDTTPEEFDVKVKEYPTMMRKIGWTRPTAPKRVYRVRIEGWGDDHDLCADSEVSCLDAYLKALCYSELHDLGGTSDEDGPEDNAYFRQVPQDFPYYPSTFSEQRPELTAEIVSQWWRDELTAQHHQSMEEDCIPPNSPAQYTASSQDAKEPAEKSSPIPAKDLSDSFDRPAAAPTTEMYTKYTATAAKVTPSTTDKVKTSKSSLKPSSYGQAPKNNPSQPTTKAQELLDLLNSTGDDGLEYNVEGETIFANLILEPQKDTHPWVTASEGIQIALEVARAIDDNFAFIATSDSMSEKFPPLTDPKMTNFPSTPITLGPYAATNPNQMVLVKPGATYADGTPKPQPTIYATVRFVSTYAVRCIMQWLGPELDMRGIRFTPKAFQVPASQTSLYIMGTRHEFCPAGLKRDLARAIKMEVKADAIQGKLNRADAEALDMQNMHVKKQGLRESKLINPTNVKNLNLSKYSQSIKATMAIELANKNYPFFKHYLQQADTSGTLKLCCGDDARLILQPINPSQSEERSAKWMSKMKANAAYLHQTECHTLKGVIDPDKRVRSQWVEGQREVSVYQKKLVSVRSLLQSINDEAGNKVFHAVNRVMLGPESGSLRVATYRKVGIQKIVQKIKVSPVAWIYNYGIHICKLTVKCMDKVVSGCDFEEVLLIESSTWDSDTMAITTPFIDSEDAFVLEMEKKGFVLDITALSDKPTEQTATNTTGLPNKPSPTADAPQQPLDPNTSTIPPQEQEWAQRLNLSGNNSFTTKASDAVSRADDATTNTEGAESFNPDPSTSKRNYRDTVLEQARLKAKNAVNNANKAPPEDNDEDSLSINSNESSTSFSPGKPASNGSAASIPKTTANTRRVSKDGGART